MIYEENSELGDETRGWRVVMIPVADVIRCCPTYQHALDLMQRLLWREHIPATINPHINEVVVEWGTLAWWDENNIRYFMWSPMPSGGEGNEIAELYRMASLESLDD